MSEIEEEYLDRHEVRKRQLSGLLGWIVVFTLIVGFGSILWAVRQTQTEGSPTTLRLIDIAEEIKRGTNRIFDCTDPKGDCYKAGQRQTGKVVGSLNEVTVVASACAAGFASLPLEERVRATRDCVRQIILQGQPSKQQ